MQVFIGDEEYRRFRARDTEENIESLLLIKLNGVGLLVTHVEPSQLNQSRKMAQEV